jgi:hypothetical protein
LERTGGWCQASYEWRIALVHILRSVIGADGRVQIVAPQPLNSDYADDAETAGYGVVIPSGAEQQRGCLAKLGV